MYFVSTSPRVFGVPVMHPKNNIIARVTLRNSSYNNQQPEYICTLILCVHYCADEYICEWIAFGVPECIECWNKYCELRPVLWQGRSYRKGPRNRPFIFIFFSQAEGSESDSTVPRAASLFLFRSMSSGFGSKLTRGAHFLVVNYIHILYTTPYIQVNTFGMVYIYSGCHINVNTIHVEGIKKRKCISVFLYC